jgi:hypothetical protein
MAQPVAPRPPIQILGVASDDHPKPPVKAWENLKPQVANPARGLKTVFTTAPGRVVLHCLTLREQERFKCVSKSFLPNIEHAQRIELERSFPKEHRNLITRDLSELPMRLLLQIDDQDQYDKAPEPKVGLWEIAGSCCPKEMSCGEIWHCDCCSRPCCCWTGHCFPWEIWSKIGFLFNCGQTRSVDEDHVQRRNVAYQTPFNPDTNAVQYNYQGTHYFPLTEPSRFYDWSIQTELDSPTTWFAVLRDERAPLPKKEAPKSDEEVEPARRASLTLPLNRSGSSVSIARQESKKEENSQGAL